MSTPDLKPKPWLERATENFITDCIGRCSGCGTGNKVRAYGYLVEKRPNVVSEFCDNCAVKNGLIEFDGPMAKLKAIYDMEMNCRIESFWDGGWTFALGDSTSGFLGNETFENEDFEKGVDWLYRKALEATSTEGD